MGQELGEKTDLIKKFGDFEDEGILKRQARIGQIFSGTKFVCDLGLDQLICIPDIEAVDVAGNKFCLTDGAGNLGEKLADLINEKNNLFKCSAFQIRIGGIKGVLTVRKGIAKQ